MPPDPFAPLTSIDDGSGRLRRIVVVGGGTAGWMTAIYLNRIVRPWSCQVTLVESASIGTIGVGEATIPSLVEFLRILRLDETAFMQATAATYKLAIRFEDWLGEGSNHWHPFGAVGAPFNGLDLFHSWFRRRREAASALSYTDHSLQVALCLENKAPAPLRGMSPILEQGSYAYHLDAGAFATYLKGAATQEGVAHIFGNVEHVALAPDGAIAHVDIGAGRRIEADLFIDASGFSGLLIEKALGDRWIDWSDQMLCDRAVAMPLPKGDTFAPYTRSTALSAGWSWTIPLSTRTGNGYVYSSAHLSDDAAVETLIKRSGLPKARAADPRFLKIRVGRRSQFWLRNCVAVGLSSGFVEPLESTGIHLIQQAAMTLAHFLPDRRFDPALSRAFNQRMARVFDEVRDFIVLHYWLAKRDEPFWRESRAVALTGSLRELIELYDETGRFDLARLGLFAPPSYYSILAGSGRLPRRLVVEAEAAPPGQIWHYLDTVRAENRRFVSQMPNQAQYLAEINRRTL
ncbi:MAG: tryptophan 7-halogenase [Ancalomicrobiaceae bacterium]|nr:tryptophan 7-halogenase [Ancalomicrobiaceae bacterium]